METKAPGLLDGIWQMVRAELNGEMAPDLVTQKTVLELANGEYRVRFAGEVTDRGTFEIVANSDLPTVVLYGVEGPDAGRTIPCLYQLVGDRLRICFGIDGVTPNTFVTSGGATRYLATYRRLESAATNT